MRIIEKQSIATVFTLPYANSRYNNLIEKIIIQTSYLRVIREVLKKYNKNYLISKEYVEILFPPFKYTTHFSPRDWCRTICGAIESRNFLLRDKIVNIKKDSQLERRIGELWKEQHRRGPEQVALQSISRKLWKNILAKTSTTAAFRLARTRAAVNAAFGGYVRSHVTVRNMVKFGHQLMQDTDREWRRLRYGLIGHYHQDALIMNSFLFLIIFLSTRGRFESLEGKEYALILLDKYGKRLSEEMTMRRHSWRMTQLGHSLFMKENYQVDDNFPPPSAIIAVNHL